VTLCASQCHPKSETFGERKGDGRAVDFRAVDIYRVQYGRITEHMESQGQSFYNALKLNLQRRFSHGFQMGVSYTFAKLLTDAAEDLFGDPPINGVVQNPYDRASLRTPSPNIVPHSLVVNYLFELPFGKVHYMT